MAATISYIGIFILAGIYFIIFHQIFNVFYFGLKGMSGTIVGCVALAILTIALIIDYWKWIVGIGIVVAVLWKLEQGAEE